MRCMVCGEEKVLAEAMPAQDMAVPGFEHQTLECPGCNDTERRLVFTGRVIVRDTETTASPSGPHQTQQNGEATARNAPNPETITNGSSIEVFTAREEETSPGDGVSEFAGEVTERATLASDPPLIAQEARACADSNVSVQAWVRAVEKLRNYQADLHLRAKETEKRNWSIDFDIAWDSFAVPRHRLLASHPRKIVQSHRERLGRKRLSILDACRSQSPESAKEPDSEAVRRFNELWDSLAPPRVPKQTEVSAPPPSRATPPMSLGLVKLLEAVEAAVPSP